MKNPVSLTIPKPGLAKWGNFNHTTLVRAELFRGNGHDKVAVKTIEGIVRSAHDLSALEGISVKLKGTNLEAQTDSNGWFSMLIEKPSSNDILLFTFSGFKTIQLTIENEDFLHVNLKLAEQEKVSTRSKLKQFFSFQKNR